eukprot:12416265-Alexandrium_andersonii.AAC.1
MQPSDRSPARSEALCRVAMTGTSHHNCVQATGQRSGRKFSKMSNVRAEAVDKDCASCLHRHGR